MNVWNGAPLLAGALLLVGACVPVSPSAAGPTPRPTPLLAQAGATAPAPPTSAAPPAPVARAAPPGRPDRGAWLVVVKGCAACHGTAAEGNVVGPALVGTRLSYQTVLQETRTPHHPKMPPFTPSDLSNADVADIYAFLQSKPASAP